MDNPYRIPLDDYYRTINFSGGRSSSYMLYQILDAHDGRLPNSAVVVFANTGVEREETYEFVHEIETRWNVPITWLEYDYLDDAAGGRKDPKNVHRVVDYHTAARNGEPFRTLVKKMRVLPNVVMRKCTSELKVSTIERYCLRELAWPVVEQKRILGIRHDEPKRWKKALYEKCNTEYPMVHDHVTKARVDEFWQNQPFDLGIPSWQGNCTLCFLKGVPNLLATMRRHPELAQWWIETEEEHIRLKREDPTTTLVDFTLAQFSRRWTYRELLQRALTQQELPLEMGDDELAADCACTD